MKLGVPKETAAGERRVALVPDAIKKLAAKDVTVTVEAGAGTEANISDQAYGEVGASTGEAWSCEAVAKVAPPSTEEIGRLSQGSVLIGFLDPLGSPETTNALAAAGISSFAMEAVPRISRAQSADALSSQATVAGYRAALIAAQQLERFFPMLTTAAGTIRPAKVLVLGAGVAGLQAIATAKRLGARVSAFDVRATVAEQVESLGASFLDLGIGSDAEGEGGYARELTEEEREAQQRALGERTAQFDAVITTALVPGRPAPRLITAATVAAMKPGSVIVDMAGEAGGNCELSEAGRTVVREGVTIVAPLGLPSTMAEHASQLYARNISALLDLMVVDGKLELNFEDEVIKGACITHKGEIVHEGAKKAAAA